MSLSLGNDLSTTVGIRVDLDNNKANRLGQSLATGKNADIEVVDAFLGNSLQSNAIILGAVAKNTAYTVNLLSITEEYLKTIVKSLQTGLQIVSSAGTASNDSLAVLQKNIDQNKAQIVSMISTASFDGKALLQGDAKNLDVQVGLNVTDKISVGVGDLNNGKVFRTSINKIFNDKIALNKGAGTTYYNSANSAAEIDVDVLNNNNLVYMAATASGGHGSGTAMTSAQLGTLIFGLTDAQKTHLGQMAPAMIRLLGSAPITTASEARLQAAARGQLGTIANMTADIEAALVAVANNAGTTAQTASDVNTVIQAIATLPQVAKDAATAALATANAVAPGSHDAARNAMRSAVINALASSGSGYEVLLASYVEKAGNAAFNTNGAVTLAGLTSDTTANTNAVVQASTTLSADIKAAVKAVNDAAGTVAATRTAGTAFPVSDLGMILKDNAATNISVASDDKSRTIAQDVLQTSLSMVLSMQANIASQKSNIMAASDALRATTNVTQIAANSYLNTDYVLVAQQYSETIRTMVAAITALQAANKIPEAAQRLIDGLARG